MRLFLAVELPESVRLALAELRGRLASRLPGWRWMRPDGIHLTVRFLGEVAEADDLSHRDGWRTAAAACPVVRFEIGGIGVFPARGAPRVLWVGVDGVEPGDGLTRLAGAVERTARESGFTAEKRPFRPHLTLARAGRRGVPAAPTGVEAGRLGEVEVRDLVLFRSELSPQGARYTALDAFPLGYDATG